ncbi:MAG: hypothetical protein FIO02_00920 [Nitrosopumilales archaeon]|nr:hypothetical protein [Nitrosopumilales archaeon]
MVSQEKSYKFHRMLQILAELMLAGKLASPISTAKTAGLMNIVSNNLRIPVIRLPLILDSAWSLEKL